jgi:hypothetical protein
MYDVSPAWQFPVPDEATDHITRAHCRSSGLVLARDDFGCAAWSILFEPTPAVPVKPGEYSAVTPWDCCIKVSSDGYRRRAGILDLRSV